MPTIICTELNKGSAINKSGNSGNGVIKMSANKKSTIFIYCTRKNLTIVYNHFMRFKLDRLSSGFTEGN